jgi:hypothetical protein
MDERQARTIEQVICPYLDPGHIDEFTDAIYNIRKQAQ